MKRYSIPKYLQKRKIELLRKKIISRKFGYMFYRKTVSKILPSQARKYYLFTLVRKSFNVWFSHWYDVTTGWKHSLRAEIHHNLKIQQTHFELWKRFYLVRKKLLMKNGIAMLHHEKHKRAFQMKFCFQKWKIYTFYRRGKRERMDYARNYFKSKRFPKCLRPYFFRWMALVKVAQRFKRKLIKATQLYELRLQKNCFQGLVLYKMRKIEKRKKILAIKRRFEQKLLIKCLCRWNQYLQERAKAKTNRLLAQATYLFKIKKYFFNQLLRNTVRGKFLKEVLKTIDLLNVRRSFKKWTIFVKKQRKKKFEYEMLANKRKTRLKLNALHSLEKYVKHKQEKRRNFEAKVLETKIYLRKSKIKFCLAKWRLLTRIKNIRAVKAIKLFKLNNQKTLQRHFSIWRALTRYKQHRRQMNCKALKHYQTCLQKLCFTKILNRLTVAKKLQEKIEQARAFYQAHLIEEAVRVIALAGIREKDKLLKSSIEKVSRELFISQKYLSIWKNSTFYKRPHGEAGTPCEQTFRPKLEWFVLLPRVFNSSFN